MWRGCLGPQGRRFWESWEGFGVPGGGGGCLSVWGSLTGCGRGATSRSCSWRGMEMGGPGFPSPCSWLCRASAGARGQVRGGGSAGCLDPPQIAGPSRGSPKRWGPPSLTLQQLLHCLRLHRDGDVWGVPGGGGACAGGVVSIWGGACGGGGACVSSGGLGVSPAVGGDQRDDQLLRRGRGRTGARGGASALATPQPPQDPPAKLRGHAPLEATARRPRLKPRPPPNPTPLRCLTSPRACALPTSAAPGPPPP